MLEGKEVEKTFDDGAGQLTVDVDAKGGVKLELTYKKDVEGYVTVKSSNVIETNIFTIAEKIAKETKVTWDDAAIALFKRLLGVEAETPKEETPKEEAPAVEAKA